MKYILTAAMMAFLVLFASTGCDDKTSEDAAEVLSTVESSDVGTESQTSDAETDVVAPVDDTAESDGSSQTEVDTDDVSGPELPGDATEANESDGS